MLFVFLYVLWVIVILVQHRVILYISLVNLLFRCKWIVRLLHLISHPFLVKSHPLTSSCFFTWQSHHYVLSKSFLLLFQWRFALPTRVIAVFIGPDHFKLLNNFHGFFNVQGKRLVCFFKVDFTLLNNLVFSDSIKIRKRLVQESSDVLNLLQNLCVVRYLNKLN